MFDEKLFFKLCEEYGVEITENSENPGIYVTMSDGIVREVDDNVIDEIIGPPLY